MATIDDVARLAGVGRTTVSHALSGNRYVAAATRERIMAAVEQLSYQPNAAARSLVSRRTMTVGLIVPLDLHVLSDSRATDFIVSASDRLAHHGYRLLCLVARNPDPLEVQVLVRSGQVDGTLLLQVRTVDSRVAALQAEGKPFVTIGRPRHAAGVVRADADFTKAAEMAVQYLVGLGHTCMGFVSSGQDDAPVFGFQWHSLAGFRRAHRTHGLPLQRGQLLYHDQETEPGLTRALAPLLQGRLPITALITSTFIDAALALQVLHAHGRQVPKDVSILALGENRATVLAQPQITVMRFSAEDLTCTSVDLLVGMLNGHKPARLEHLLPVDLIIRDTTGPAPSVPAPAGLAGAGISTVADVPAGIAAEYITGKEVVAAQPVPLA